MMTKLTNYGSSSHRFSMVGRDWLQCRLKELEKFWNRSISMGNVIIIATTPITTTTASTTAASFTKWGLCHGLWSIKSTSWWLALGIHGKPLASTNFIGCFVHMSTGASSLKARFLLWQQEIINLKIGLDRKRVLPVLGLWSCWSLLLFSLFSSFAVEFLFNNLKMIITPWKMFTNVTLTHSEVCWWLLCYLYV